jgi:hypothetical protein
MMELFTWGYVIVCTGQEIDSSRSPRRYILYGEACMEAFCHWKDRRQPEKWSHVLGVIGRAGNSY